MFCRNCGCDIAGNVKFCPKCGTMVIDSPEVVEVAPDKKKRGKKKKDVPKKKKSKIVPVIIVLFLLVAAGVLGFGAYGVVKTNEFKEEMAQFEGDAKEFASLGKYQSTYDELLNSSKEASSGYRFWEYESLAEQMSELVVEINSMNTAVETYRQQYTEIVEEIETDSKYIMTDYEEDYQSAKKALEDSLSEFDENACKSNVKALSDMRDTIVTGNAQTAKTYLDDVEDVKEVFSNYSLHPFEEYMLGDLVESIEADRNNLDYIKLQEDYNEFKVWSDKFGAALSSNQQVESFVQADVSGEDEVKIYITPNDYQEYDFKLEDFIVYERQGEVWQECYAEDISQIEGMLTMDIVADISGSMRNDFYDMQCAIEGFVDETHADTQLGLSTIGSIYERYQEFTTDKSAIKDSVWNLECYGLTSLYQSLYSSVVYTASAEGARCVVAFTDGKNEPYGAGYDYDAQDVIDVSLYYQVPVYIIGIGNHVSSSELRNIAESTGGAYYANMTVYDLQDVYMDIYTAQGRMYQLSYKTETPNDTNRDLYVLYADETLDLSVRIDSEVNAQALQNAYESAGLTGNDLTAFYTGSKYLSSDDLAKLGDSLEAVQTVINIYYAKNGYQFGSGENGQKQLAKMIDMGVISQNGTKDGDEVTEILRSDPVIWQNFSALYNYRYELVYSVALDIYRNNPYISYEELRRKVSEYYGEENEVRYDPVISSAWKNIRAGQ